MKSFVIRLLPVLHLATVAWATGGPTCATSTVVTISPFADSGTLDAPYADSCAGSPANDVFYSFTAPQTGDYRFSLCGSTNSNELQMRLWTNGTCCSGNQVTVNDGCWDGNPAHTLSLTANQTVVVEIGVPGLEHFNTIIYLFSVLNSTSVSYDSCPGRNIAELPFQDNADLLNAQDNFNACNESNSNRDVVYHFYWPEQITCVMTTCFGFGFGDLLLEVRQSIDGTCENTFSVACGDDECGDGAQITHTFLSQTHYYIILDSRNEAFFTFFQMREVVPTCPGKVIPQVPYYAMGHTFDADDSYNACGVGGGSRDDVYSFSPGENMLCTVSLCGTPFNSALEVFQSVDGTCNNLISVACNDDFCGTQSRFTYSFRADSTYFIVVDAVGGEYSEYYFSVTRALNDDCENAIDYATSNQPVVIYGSTADAENDFESCADGAGRDVVYRLSSSTSQPHVSFEVHSQDFAPTLAICNGVCGVLSPVAFDVATPCGFGGIRTALLPPGENFVVVDGADGESGSFVLTMAEVDLCPGHPLTNFPVVVAGSVHGFPDIQLCASDASADLYHYAPQVNTYVGATSCGAAPVELRVTRRLPGSCEFSQETIAQAGTYHPACGEYCDARSVYFNAQPPYQYQIAIAAPSMTDYQVRIDEFSGSCPTEIQSLPFSASWGHLHNSYVSCGVGFGNDRFFSFAPETTTVCQVSYVEPGFDVAVLSILRKPEACLDAPFEVACDSDMEGVQRQLVFEFLGGTSYFVVADQVSVNAGLSPTLSIVPCAPADLIPDSLTILPDGSNVQLQWTEANCSPLQYHVHRTTQPNIAPSPTNLIATTLATSYTDSNVVSLPSDRHFYVVTTSIIE